MDKGLDQLVRIRAGNACEYCGFPAAFAELPLVADHIVAREHLGPTTAENLALCCGICNAHKGPNVAGFDPPPAGALTRLFNPRVDRWTDDFDWKGVRIVPLTDVGRVTEYVLALNHAQQIRRRRALMEEGVWTPPA